MYDGQTSMPALVLVYFVNEQLVPNIYRFGSRNHTSTNSTSRDGGFLGISKPEWPTMFGLVLTRL